MNLISRAGQTGEVAELNGEALRQACDHFERSHDKDKQLGASGITVEVSSSSSSSQICPGKKLYSPLLKAVLALRVFPEGGRKEDALTLIFHLLGVRKLKYGRDEKRKPFLRGRG